jgi:hypothetical protein
MYTAEPAMSEPSSLEVEISSAELKRYEAPNTDQISAALFQTRGNTICS